MIIFEVLSIQCLQNGNAEEDIELKKQERDKLARESMYLFNVSCTVTACFILLLKLYVYVT